LKGPFSQGGGFSLITRVLPQGRESPTQGIERVGIKTIAQEKNTVARRLYAPSIALIDGMIFAEKKYAKDRGRGSHGEGGRIRGVSHRRLRR